MTYACETHTSACGFAQCGVPLLDVTRALRSYVVIPRKEVLRVNLACISANHANSPALVALWQDVNALQCVAGDHIPTRATFKQEV